MTDNGCYAKKEEEEVVASSGQKCILYDFTWKLVKQLDDIQMITFQLKKANKMFVIFKATCIVLWYDVQFWW